MCVYAGVIVSGSVYIFCSNTGAVYIFFAFWRKNCRQATLIICNLQINPSAMEALHESSTP